MDLTSVKTIKELCEKFNFGFSKGLGQNFLLDRQALEKICAAADCYEGALEIGPGFGVLTAELAESFERVVSVEIDSSLIPVLEYTLADKSNVRLINADILKIDIAALLREEFGEKKVTVAANLPYYITTPIITALLEGGYNIDSIIVMVQREVAERLCAAPGSKACGAISALTAYYTIPEIVTIVPAGSFFPAPKVDSAVVRLKLLGEPRVKVKDEKLFFRVVKAAFAQRRKTLLNCLSSGFGTDKNEMKEAILHAGADPGIRGERLTLEELAAITESISPLVQGTQSR